MELTPGRPSGGAHDTSESRIPRTPRLDALEASILGDARGHGHGPSLPPVTELAAALTALARGLREKALLPLPSEATELALLRRGESVLVSCYGTGSTPDVHVLNRAVPLDAALDAVVQATLEAAELERDPVAKQIATRLAERAMRASDGLDTSPAEPTVHLAGGARESDVAVTPLCFGYEIALHPPSLPAATGTSRADVHALLFDGTLWAFVRGRRVVLSRGPIMLAVQRMVAAVRSIVEARDAGRAVNLRLRAGGFRVAARTTVGGEATITLGGEGEEEVTATALTIAEACLPILRVTTDLLRALVAVDRSQGRNLRVRALREEVRALRRAVKRKRRTSFLNLDAERLRLEMAPALDAEARASAREDAGAARSLRFGERWRLAMDGLDATATFLCGDRLVVATAHHTVALSRDRGEVLWARDGENTTAFLAGSSLLRVAPEGEVELCDVADGEPYATARISPRVGGPLHAIAAGGGALPPMAVLTEGSHRLVAIDLRTGEPRWRFASRGGGAFELAKAGRILLVACGEGSLHALDLATGDELWRHARETRFPFAPSAIGDVALAVSAGGADGPGALHGIDLFSGEQRYRIELPGAPLAGVGSAGGVALVASSSAGGPTLSAYDAASGTARFRAVDPGIGAGGAMLHVDESIVVNAPNGRLSALDVATGKERWSLAVADPLADDVPRRLSPLLRGGALFVPSASVHVVRPHDGTRLGAGLPCDLVPDALRVDERGWVYVAEESGHIAAYAPVPHLSLLRGGASA